MTWEGMGVVWCEKCGMKISANTTWCGCNSPSANKVRKTVAERAEESRFRQWQEDKEREEWKEFKRQKR